MIKACSDTNSALRFNRTTQLIGNGQNTPNYDRGILTPAKLFSPVVRILHTNSNIRHIALRVFSLLVFLILVSGCGMNKDVHQSFNYNPIQPVGILGRFCQVAIMLKSGTMNIDEAWSNIHLPIMPPTMDIPRQSSFAQPEEIILKYPFLSWVDMQKLKESLFQTGQVEYIRVTQIYQP